MSSEIIKLFEGKRKKLENMVAKDQFVSATFALSIVNIALDEMKDMQERIAKLEQAAEDAYYDMREREEKRDL